MPRIALLGCCLAIAAPALDLTEVQALKLLRESPYRSELEADLDIARARAMRGTVRDNPAVRAELEGAGRTEFYVLEQPLSVNGRRALLRLAGSAAVRAAALDADHRLRLLEAQLRHAFFELAYAQLRKALIGDGLGDLRGLRRILADRVAAGDAARLELLRAEREIVEAETSLAESDALLAAGRARLAHFLGSDMDPVNLQVAGSLEAGYELPALREALADALEARGDYRAEAERLQQLDLEGRAAERRRIPNPTVVAGLKRADLGSDIGNQYGYGPMVGISVDLPVFNKGQADRAMAAAERDRSRARRSVIASQIVADVRAAYQLLRLRRRIAADYRSKALTRARELLGIAEVAYEESEIGVLDLLGAYRDLQGTSLRLLELQASAKLAEVEFDRSVAKELVP